MRFIGLSVFIRSDSRRWNAGFASSQIRRFFAACSDEPFAKRVAFTFATTAGSFIGLFEIIRCRARSAASRPNVFGFNVPSANARFRHDDVFAFCLPRSFAATDAATSGLRIGLRSPIFDAEILRRISGVAWPRHSFDPFVFTCCPHPHAQRFRHDDDAIVFFELSNCFPSIIGQKRVIARRAYRNFSELQLEQVSVEDASGCCFNTRPRQHRSRLVVGQHALARIDRFDRNEAAVQCIDARAFGDTVHAAEHAAVRQVPLHRHRRRTLPVLPCRETVEMSVDLIRRDVGHRQSVSGRPLLAAPRRKSRSKNSCR